MGSFTACPSVAQWILTATLGPKWSQHFSVTPKELHSRQTHWNQLELDDVSSQLSSTAAADVRLNGLFNLTHVIFSIVTFFLTTRSTTLFVFVFKYLSN